jgi:Fe-S oxidoreductase/FAD/FMN-containing dehydrogenase
MGEFFGPGARTSDHVQSLEVLTYDGIRMHVGPTSDEDLAHLVQRTDRIGDIYRRLVALRDRYADLIRRRFAQIPRRVSGYNLEALLPENGFNVARALVGSEGTCVTILEAELSVYPAKAQRALVVLGYKDVYAAGDHIPQIRSFKPIGLEGMDDRLVDDMKRNHIHPRDVELLPPGKGWLLAEFGADDVAEAEAQARRMMEALRREPDAPSMKLFDDPAETKKLWEVREAGLGATAFIPGRKDAWPGWEDSAVPVDKVGAYLRELQKLFEKHGLDAALYGHFGQGCIHCRISFTLGTEEGRAVYRAFTADAADLVVSFGGSISGEHGDGQARGDLIERQFGPELIAAFREFKAIWDPEDRMNPGKIVDGQSRTDNLKLADYHPERLRTTFEPQQDNGDFRHSALRCVGIGNCRRSSGGTMCPSFRVTHDEKHTTRGRARALFEMLEGDIVQDGWKSDAVKDTLDLCLSCKGCKGDCPVHVDIATYKSEFLSHYYEHRLRPRHAYALGWIHRWAQLGSYVPSLANFVTGHRFTKRMFDWLGGLTNERPVPRFADEPFTRSFVDTGDAGEPVILWPDTFNNYFLPGTLDAAVEVLRDAGYRVIVPRTKLCCGRALYDYGMLDEARALWERTFRVLAPAIRSGIPVVGLEPSCVAAFHDELPNLFPRDARARALATSTYTLAGFLRKQGYRPPPLAAHVLLHGHCHHKAVLDFDAERALLDAMHVDFEMPEPGCCGLAGSFGFEREHYDVSMQIGEQALLPAVREAAFDTLLVADGFSCREQIRHGTGRGAFHLAELVALALRRMQELPVDRRVVTPQSASLHAP